MKKKFLRKNKLQKTPDLYLVHSILRMNDIGVDITSMAIEAEVPIEFSKEAYTSTNIRMSY